MKFTAEHEALRKTVRDFVEKEINPYCDEWEEAGFREIFASPGLKLVEWPEKAGQHLPAADLVLAIELADADERRVSVHALTPAGAWLLKA